MSRDKVKGGYTGHVPGKHEMIGSSYRSHDNTIPGRRMMTPPSRELAAQMATPPKKVADSTNSEWIQSQKKLQTVFGADQKLDQFDNVRNLVQTSARVATVVTDRSLGSRLAARLKSLMEFVPYHPGNNKFTSEFIAENFGPHKMDMSVEEKFGVVPPPLSKTSKMNDPGPPRKMRVKSGYTGHVPHGRDYIGGSYKAHDNRGTASKEDVPILHVDGSGGYPIPVVPKKSNMSKLIYSQDPHSSKAGDLQHDYGVTTTAPVAARVEKVLSGDTSDMSDAENRTSAFDQEGAGQWIMAGYTGHVPKGREVYGTSYYGPPEGPSYHGPFYTSDIYGSPGSPNKEAICP